MASRQAQNRQTEIQNRDSVHDTEVRKTRQTILDEHITVELKSRQQWPNKLQFLCANISYAVGLGNIWRFPYLAAKNGGGTFLIPYFISLVFIGIPLLMTEMSMGQRLRCGAIEGFTKFHPGFTGVGIAMAFISFVVGVYYTMISGWSLFYLFESFQDPLPWSTCPRELQNISVGLQSLEIPYPETECDLAGSANYFWYRDTLNISSGLMEVNGVQEAMILSLIIAWFVIFSTMMNGSESAGAKLYFIAFFPYVVLTVFLVIGLIQKGGIEGLLILMSPDWDLLGTASIWIDASSQIFYSFGVCFGGLIAFSSYNPINQNMIRDGLIVAAFNCGTSVFAACVIFALLGGSAETSYSRCISNQTDYVLTFLNQPEDFLDGNSTEEIFDTFADAIFAETNLNLTSCDFETILIEDIPQGTGLTFIAIARAVVPLPASFIFAILFYMLITMLGIGSMIGTLEGVLTPIADALENYKSTKNISKRTLMVMLCIVHFLIGIIFTTAAGNYWLDIFNDYSANINLLMVGLFQYIFIHWMFGSAKWINEMQWMIGDHNAFYSVFLAYLKFCSVFISPFLIAFIVCFFVYDMIANPPGYRQWDAEIGDWDKDPETDEDVIHPYEPAGTATIALLHVLAMMWIPIFIVKGFYKDGTLRLSNWKKHEDALIFVPQKKDD